MPRAGAQTWPLQLGATQETKRGATGRTRAGALPRVACAAGWDWEARAAAFCGRRRADDPRVALTL